MKTVRTIILILVLSCLLSCEQLKPNNVVSDALRSGEANRSVKTSDLATTSSNLAEVTSPPIIKELNQELKQYSPRVKIIAPIGEKTLNQTDVVIKLAVEDLPIFQDDKLQLGNHLNLIVDNEPSQPIYSLDEPIIIKNLAPGTHTIRVLAVNPWGESFKNEGAYAQTTFNVLTETNTNRPNSELPLLTYNSPTGTYGAEPMLLDFYLNHGDSAINFARSKGITKTNPDEQKWRVKATVNGTSFIIEDWQPYYLTGFEPGENWIQLELVDKLGNTIENTFNNTVRVFTYNPQQQDNLAKLVTNKISFDDAQSIIVKQSYYIQPETNSEIIDLKDSDRPEIITNESETPEQAPEEFLTTNQVNQLEEPISPTPAESTPSQPINPQQTRSNEIADTNTKTTADSLVNKADEPLIQDSNKAAAKVEPKPMASKIVITESNSPEEEETIAEIIIPPSESLKIVKSDEVAIAIPANDSEGDSLEPKSTSGKFLWWKKILVGIRQIIEALARQLPSEV